MEPDHEKAVHLHGLWSNLIKKCAMVSEGSRMVGVCMELQELYFAGLQSVDHITSFSCQGIDYLVKFLAMNAARSLEAGLTIKNKLLLSSVVRLGAVDKILNLSPVRYGSCSSDTWIILGGCASCGLINPKELAEILLRCLDSSGDLSSHKKGALLTLSLSGKTISFLNEDAASVSKALCCSLLQSQTVDGKLLGKGKKTALSGSRKGSVLEIDGSPCRDIVTVLNIQRSMNSHAVENIYAFSVLNGWLLYVGSHVGAANSTVKKSLSRLSLGSHGSSPSAIGGNRFFDDISSGSGSSDGVSLSSSMSSLQSSFDAEGEYYDRLDSKLLHNRLTSELVNRSSVAGLHHNLASEAWSATSISHRASQSSYDPRGIQIAELLEEPSLITAAVTYCLRIINQSDRTPQHKSDYEVIAASVIESIEILKNICKQDSALGPKVFPEIKRLCQRLEGKPWRARKVYVALLDFILAHHKEMVLNVEEMLNVYFHEIPLHGLLDSFAAFELFDLCLRNEDYLLRSSNVMSKHFPNLLKLVAWHPYTFMETACELMPLFLHGLGSANELLHCLLDLPSVCALLELQQLKLLGDLSVTQQREKLERVLGKTIPPYFKSITSFILRERSGGAETISKLSEFHSLLACLDSNLRVKYVADIVAPLLSAYFSAVKGLSDRNILTNIFPVLLERAHLLFPQGSLVVDVQEFFIEKIEWILNAVPCVLAVYQEEVLSSLSIALGLQSHSNSFARGLIYCIGEFSPRASACDYEQVAKYYDRVESVAYEAVQTFVTDPKGMWSPEMMCMISSCMAKLAAYNQELIPRAVVCLSKISGLEWNDRQYSIDFEEFVSVVSRAQEMICVLERPKGAPALLCGDARLNPWHLDPNASLLLKVQAIC